MSKITKSAITYRHHRTPAVYLITNMINSKVYVGQTVNLYVRYARHRRSAHAPSLDRRRIVAAFRKHGFENFSFSILEEPPIALLTEREQFWMDNFKSYDSARGYNIAPVAGSTLGVKHSAETRAKVSLASTGRRHTESSKRLLSIAHKGKTLSADCRQKISMAKKGTKVPAKRGRQVEQIDKATGEIVALFCSASAAHRAVGGGISPILDTCKGKRRNAGGYLWRFVCPE